MSALPTPKPRDPLPSVAQIRAARALVDWSQDRLAQEAEIGRATVGDFERGARQPNRLSLKAMKAALESGGIMFLWSADGGEGVMIRRRPTSPKADS